MKRLVFLCVVAAALAAHAWAWGSLVASYASPATDPKGLGYLAVTGGSYITLTAANGYVYRLYRSNGSVQGSYATTGGITYGCDSGAMGGFGYTWVVKQTPNYIRRYGFMGGSLYSSFAAPTGSPAGVAYRNAGGTPYLYITDANSNLFYIVNAGTGSVYSYYAMSGFSPRDLAYDAGRNCLWVADFTHTDVRRVSLTGSTLGSFDCGGYPHGLAYDGVYVWVSFITPTNRINVYEVGNTPVETASFGRLKALFR